MKSLLTNKKSISCVRSGLLFFFFLFAFSNLGNAAITDSLPASARVGKVWKWRMLHKARRLDDRSNYEKSRAVYLRLLEADSTYFKANYELAIQALSSYNHRDESLNLLERAYRHMPADTVVPFFWYYGNALQFSGKYEDAIRSYQLFQRLKGETFPGEWQGLSDLRIQQCKTALDLRANMPKDIRVVNLGNGINTEFAEYVPVVNEGDSILLYTSRRSSTTGGRIDLADEKYFEDMYISRDDSANFKSSEQFHPGGSYIGNLLNTRDHESVVSLAFDETVLVIYNRNDLWFSLRDSAMNWTSPVRFDDRINCGDYQPHGSFTEDGTIFYFTSDVEGGAGGLDLYYVERFADGSWSERRSLGPSVNTPSDEDSPQIGADGKTLFFSSKGHNAIGGYDIFYTQRDSLGNWTKAINLGFPYNSPGDDIFFKADSSLHNGYMASFRQGGFGDMDIYRFQTWDAADFNTCNPFVNRSYRVSVNATQSVDAGGRQVVYRWEMGDGKILFGEKIDYDYKRFGNYDLTLTIFDPLTGVIEQDEYHTAIELPKHDHLEIVAADTVCQDSIVKLDASYCNFAGQENIHYFWKIGSRQGNDLVTLNYEFDSLGINRVVLQLVTTSSDTALPQRWCVEKEIVVLNASDYAAYLQRQKIREQFIPLFGDTSNVEIPIDLAGGANPANTYTNSGIKLRPIFYDFDQSFIRADAQRTLDSNIAILRTHPDMIIKVVSHTDARGTDNYNIALSQRRAKEAIFYLEQKGVPRNRIAAVLAVGESEPANLCKDDVECDEAQHQFNRRTDFFLVTPAN